MRVKSSLRSRAGRWALCAAACLALATAAAGRASAQEIEPNEFVPAPDGTNLAIGYYIYGDNTSYNVKKGPTISDSGVQVNVGILRLVHYDYVAGMPAGVQVLEAFGNESAAHIGSEGLGSATGASNLNLSAFIWPYANTEDKQYLIIAGFIYPPVGTYNKYQAVNLATAFTPSYNWTGDVQVGWDMGIGDHFSYDLSFDYRDFGDNTSPAGLQTRTPDYRLQAWANWNWTRAFQTSIGWESILGGRQYTDGQFNGATSQFERLRVAASMFVAPNAQVLVEFNHDVSAPGGFKQDFGATARLLFIF